MHGIHQILMDYQLLIIVSVIIYSYKTMCKLNIIITILTSLFGSGAGFPSPEPRRLLGLEEVKSFLSVNMHTKKKSMSRYYYGKFYLYTN